METVNHDDEMSLDGSYLSTSYVLEVKGVSSALEAFRSLVFVVDISKNPPVMVGAHGDVSGSLEDATKKLRNARFGG